MTEPSSGVVRKNGTDPEMQVLIAEECNRHLATQQIGRLGVT